MINRSPARYARDGLPPLCAARHPLTGAATMIRAGEAGYYLAPPDLDVEAYNAARGITVEQAEQMLDASLFGWRVSIAAATAGKLAA
jgi:hypothetical protein